MKSRILLIMLFALVASTGYSQKKAKKKADKQTQAWRYEIQCAGVGIDGTYLVKVWSFSKKAKVATEQAKKNAVHGIIFKGFVGNSVTRCPTQRPLAKSPNLEMEKEDFFKPFFEDGGKYMKFVNVSSDGNIGAKDVIKVGKEYKVGVVVSVSKDLLRKDLEDAGIIRGLTSGF